MDKDEFKSKAEQVFIKYRDALRVLSPQSRVTLHQAANIEYRVVTQGFMTQPQQFVMWLDKGEPKWGILLEK